MPLSVKNIAKEIGADKYIISGNGTLIYDVQNEKNIYEVFMEKEKVLQIVKICEENSIYYNLYTENSVITKNLNYNTLYYDSENSKKPEQKRTNIEIVENIQSYIQQMPNIKVLKITICDNDKIIFSRIMKKLKKISKINILEVEHMSRKYIRSGSQSIPIEYFYTEISRRKHKQMASNKIFNKKIRNKTRRSYGNRR